MTQTTTTADAVLKEFYLPTLRVQLNQNFPILEAVSKNTEDFEGRRAVLSLHVGRSGGVTGSLTIDGGQLTDADITVDMTTIVSNDSRRENAIRGAVGASENPTATFVLTAPVELPDGIRDGEVVTVDAVGDLTVNGVTNSVTFTISALVRDDGFGVITGSTNIVFEDFDVTPPSAPIVVSIDDNGIVEFQLIVTKG